MNKLEKIRKKFLLYKQKLFLLRRTLLFLITKLKSSTCGSLNKSRRKVNELHARMTLMQM